MSAPQRPSVGKPMGAAQVLALIIMVAQGVEDERLVTKPEEQ